MTKRIRKLVMKSLTTDCLRKVLDEIEAKSDEVSFDIDDTNLLLITYRVPDMFCRLKDHPGKIFKVHSISDTGMWLTCEIGGRIQYQLMPRAQILTDLEVAQLNNMMRGDFEND